MTTQYGFIRRNVFVMCVLGTSAISDAAQAPPVIPPTVENAEPQSPVVALDLTPVSETDPPAIASAREPADKTGTVPPEGGIVPAANSEASSDESPTESGAEGSVDPDAPPKTVSPEIDVKKDATGDSVILESDDDELGKRIDRLFRINENSMSWVLRGGDTDGIGFFSWASTPSWDFEFNQDEGLEAEFHSSIHWVDGPGRTDLPARLYDLSWHVRLWEPDFIQISGQPSISLEANFDIGIHSDFEDSAREGWRFPGRVLVMQESSSGFWWTAGFEYVDLERIQMLPAGGFVLKSEDAQLDLYFPRPKLRVRAARHERHDDWIYIEGEYVGRAWAIERSTTGLADMATLTEYRLGVGWESVPTRREKDDDGDSDPKTSFFDVSWLFGRDLEYRSGAGNYQPHDTVMFRVGSRY